MTADLSRVHKLQGVTAMGRNKVRKVTIEQVAKLIAIVSSRRNANLDDGMSTQEQRGRIGLLETETSLVQSRGATESECGTFVAENQRSIAEPAADAGATAARQYPWRRLRTTVNDFECVAHDDAQQSLERTLRSSCAKQIGRSLEQLPLHVS